MLGARGLAAVVLVALGASGGPDLAGGPTADRPPAAAADPALGSARPAGAPPGRAASTGPALSRPVPGPVVRPFDTSAGPYAAGHRGVDLAAPEGSVVRAAAAGTISFVGRIDGVAWVTVRHPAGWRTTYGPVAAPPPVGVPVDRSQPIGLVGGGGPHPGAGRAATATLHWGLRRGDRYVDPLAHLAGPVTIRLVPTPARAGR